MAELLFWLLWPSDISPISSNNKNQNRTTNSARVFSQLLLENPIHSHINSFLSFPFPFFYSFFCLALKRFVLFSCTCLLRLCCENTQETKKQRGKVAAQCTNPACGSHFLNRTPCATSAHTWKLTYFAALGDFLLFLCRAKRKCKFTLDASKFK